MYFGVALESVGSGDTMESAVYHNSLISPY
jgi:hypothetical protein